jgi:MFS family permease
MNPVTSSAGHSGAVVEEVQQRSVSHPAPADYMSIYTSRTFVNSTLVSAIAQILMLIMMIGSILKMNDLGFTLVQQALVLDFHFFAMFGTGFFTSYLLKSYSIYAVLAVAWGLIGVAVIFFLCSDSLWAFFIGDFLVGVGWNIMFSTGTVMLSFCYAPHQRHHVQSVFEIIINTISGIFTIVSGIILSVYGWSHVVYGILGIFAALSLGAPLYGRYYTDSSATFADKKRNSVNSDIECSGVEA